MVQFISKGVLVGLGWCTPRKRETRVSRVLFRALQAMLRSAQRSPRQASETVSGVVRVRGGWKERRDRHWNLEGRDV